ncbi:MAG: MerR family transcriptional regulator [Alphaproteobacteria bacterium]|nr:MerR family transcriptional regulator [Alphaproteobacteria bacterium]
MTEVPPVATEARKKAPPPAIGPTPKRAGAYLTIAEMAAELGVATHVLRFWESKFPVLQPMKASGGRRFYHEEAAAVARHIQSLLYQQKLTIKGAQAVLAKQKPRQIAAQMGLSSAMLQAELKAILQTLEGREPEGRA